MQIRTAGIWRASAALLMAGSVAACTVDSQEPPSLAGPSGLAQSLTMSVSPDRIAHNGAAQSVVTVTMNGDAGPVSGQRVSLGASSGSLSHADVVTGSDGRATFVVTAPALSTPAEKVVVFATPVGTDANSALTRSVSIALTGTLNATAPTAAFTTAPDAPKAGGAVVFDASGTTDEGQSCGSLCSYSWNFGDSTSGSGITATRTYAAAGTFVVTLTVVDNAGSADTAVRVVTVAP